MKLVMFDLDGTLYRTETSFFPAVRRFADRYGFAAARLLEIAAEGHRVAPTVTF